MKVIFFSCLILCFFSASLFAQPAVLWDKTYGGMSNSESALAGLGFLRVVKSTNDKGIILFGENSSTVGFEKSEPIIGSSDWWIIKTDTNGKIIWNRTIGNKGADWAGYSVLENEDGALFLSGTSQLFPENPGYGGFSDGRLVKLGKEGNILWDIYIGGEGNDFILEMVKINENRFLLSMVSNSNADNKWKSENSRGTTDDYWIVCIDSLGNKIWDKTYGGTGNDNSRCLVKVNDNLFIIGGDSDSNVGDDKSESNRGEYDLWLVAFDSLGNKLWDKTYGGTDTDYISDIKVISDAIIIIANSFSPKSFEKSENRFGFADIWAIKTDFLGNKLWDKTIGGLGSDQATDCLIINDNILVSVVSESDKNKFKTDNSKGLEDYWIFQMNKDGNILWDKTIGGDIADRNPYLLLLPDQSIYLAGTSMSNISGDKTEGRRDTLSQGDYWLVKLVEGPTIRKVEVMPICSGTKVSFQVKVDGNAPFAVYVDDVLTGSFMEKEFTVEDDFSFNPVLKVIDKDGKTVTQTLSATRPDQYLRFRIATQKSGIQPGGGAIVVQAFGGVPPYTYQLDNGTLTDNGIFTGLNSGIYVATITDSKGCKISRQIEVK